MPPSSRLCSTRELVPRPDRADAETTHGTPEIEGTTWGHTEIAREGYCNRSHFQEEDLARAKRRGAIQEMVSQRGIAPSVISGKLVRTVASLRERGIAIAVIPKKKT